MGQDLPDNVKLSDYYGIAKLEVRPPRKLLHPVLPLRVDSKLMFPLCARCAQERNQETCHHTDEERGWIGTYCVCELLEAEKHGYTFPKIYELYSWDKTSTYSPSSKTGGLFTEYVNLFLKFKQESSGYPQSVTSETDKAEYIAEYLDKEGIQLDPENIRHNPGLHTVSKNSLNSFWGR